MARSQSHVRRCFFFILFLLLVSGWLHAAAVSGTVKDGTGAVVANARVEIGMRESGVLFSLKSDALGHFVSPDLKPGTYFVRATADGFEPFETSVEVVADPVNLAVRLSPAVAKQEITVTGKSRFANSDPVYQALRGSGLGTAFQVEGFSFKCDVATFELKQGTMIFLAPVNGVVTGMIFMGSGHFTLKPVTGIARAELNRRIKSEQVDEDFNQIVFRYTGEAGRSCFRRLRRKWQFQKLRRACSSTGVTRSESSVKFPWECRRNCCTARSSRT
jgi:Carboxypeptidase regulatory-like domain